MKTFNPLLARILIILIFLTSGINFILDPEGTKAYMGMNGMTRVGFFYIAAIIILLAGSLSIVSGYYMRYGALMLMVYLIPATLIFHSDIGQPGQLIQAMKNAGLFGGLIFVYNLGNEKPKKKGHTEQEDG